MTASVATGEVTPFLAKLWKILDEESLSDLICWDEVTSIQQASTGSLIMILSPEHLSTSSTLTTNSHASCSVASLRLVGGALQSIVNGTLFSRQPSPASSDSLTYVG